MSVTLLCALFTNLVGNTLAASRLLCAMADDGALPPWFGRRGPDGSPRNAAIALSAVAFAAAPLGRTIVGIILDTALVGAVVAYAYASAATFRTARAEGRRLAAASGLTGIALSVAMALLFAVPNLLGEGAPMATESYLALAIWCLAGLLAFLSVFLRDHGHRFGRSAVVWISLLAVILALSVLWVRQSVRDTSRCALVRIETVVEDSPEIRAAISDIEHASIRNSFVLIGATALAFALLFVLYRVLAHRERDTERERARAKSYFFSTVSHDIRTPLNAIIGYSEMLRAGFQTEEERVQAVDSILVSGRTLLALVNDVLDLSKLESGRMEIIPEPTDCPRLLREMADAFSASSGNQLLELRVRTGEMPHLMLDPQRLRQILFNLVGNAVKFTERGHVELRAAWDRAADAATGTFRLAVEDTGCGISMRDRDIVSNAYVQVGSRKGRNGGTGLGLAICKQLADAMGGSLDIESEIGKGSTFTVTIPGVHPAPGAPSSPQTAAMHPSAPAHAAGAKAAPRRVLVVDDVKINLSVLQAQLRKLGITETVPAMDGRQALDILESPDSSPFDLVLTDMWMPVMDGEALVRAIRDAPALRALRVIAVTADVELKDKFASMGFDDILLKPVTADKLARCLTGDGVLFGEVFHVKDSRQRLTPG